MIIFNNINFNLDENKIYGYTLKELIEMEINDFNKLISIMPSTIRKFFIKGIGYTYKKFYDKIKENKKIIFKTHLRSFPILPSMINKKIFIYNGKIFIEVILREQMLFHKLGEFSLTRKYATHKAIGVGGTKGKRVKSH